MSDFTDLQDQINDASSDWRQAGRARHAASEKLAKQQRKIQAARRQGQAGTSELEILEAERLRLEDQLNEKDRLFENARSSLHDSLSLFERYSDPTKQIGEFDDSFPIVLFPVRIETRFKKLRDPNGALQTQLWLRIFPDDVLVDTFEELPAEVEVANTRQYWLNRWRAGQSENELRAAWKTLVSSHGSGRANWLIERIVPVTDTPQNQEPEKQAGEHLLVIATDTLPALNEAQALETYWVDMLSGDSDAGAALVAEVGEARAGELLEAYVPENVEEPLPPGVDMLRVVWLQLPDLDSMETQLQPWAQPARVRLLPERFVVMGFNGGKQTLLRVGNVIPDEILVGPDPGALPEDQLSEEDGKLEVPDNLLWLTDFDQAVSQGMGFRIDLSTEQYDQGFERLFVLGVRLRSNPEQAREAMQELFTNHERSSAGMSFLRQGTPTNNVDEGESGYSWIEDADASYDHYFAEGPREDPLDWRTKTDGRRFAEALGLDPDALKSIPNYFATDQLEARAMNEALWPTTLGYYMEQMLNGVFEEETVDQVRGFFNRFVVGRGSIPAFRVDDQPYGVLPTTRFRNISWFEPDDRFPRRRPNRLLEKLHRVIRRAHDIWEPLSGKVASVRPDSEDAHQVLLDVLGLHPTSVEHYQRIAESFDEFFNRMRLGGFFNHVDANQASLAFFFSGMQFLESFGHEHDFDEDSPELLSKFFFQTPNLLKGPLIDDAPLSEFDGVRATHDSGVNYLQWLIDATQTSHDRLRRQQGFAGNRPPRALLYLMLRHALDLGFIQTTIRLHREFSLLSDAELKVYGREPKFYHIKDNSPVAPVRNLNTWELLYKAAPDVTSDPVMTLGEYISRTITTRDSYLQTQLAALEHLKDLPTARLERAFAEHIDCCSYRLDAWWLGLLSVQLESMRAPSSGDGARPEIDLAERISSDNDDETAGSDIAGSYIGAFGWVENLQADDQTLTKASVPDDLQELFNPPELEPLVVDDRNFGYIHAPSLNHAVTAAVLRNGYLANATPDLPDLLGINLTSSRVRIAMDVIEGMRNGQSLGALLGYQLERDLHDAEDLYLDSVIYELRGKFPLVGNHLDSTAVDEPIEAVEARNVVDGYALVEHVQQSADKDYPFGFDDLPSIPEQDKLDAINAAVNHIRNISDAVADLAMAESVYQVVQGNYDRAASTVDAYTKGNFPPTPEVVQTPRSGLALTHRVGIHLRAGLDPGDATYTTPRASGEPAVEDWLRGILPPMTDIICEATCIARSTGAATTVQVTAAQLGLSAVDLVYMLNRDAEQHMAALEDLVVWHVAGLPDTRQDGQIRITYLVKQAGKFSFFELTPLLGDLNSLLLRSRPLKGTDARLQNEARTAEDANAEIRETKVTTVRDLLAAQLAGLDTFLTGLDAILAEEDEDILVTNLAANIDDLVVNAGDVLRNLNLFGLPNTGNGYVWDWRRREFAALIASVDRVLDAWVAQKAEFNQRLADYPALDAGLTDQQRIQYLLETGLLLNTERLVPPGTNPDDLLAPLNVLLGDFKSVETALGNLRDNAATLGQFHQGLVAQADAINAQYREGLDLSAYALALRTFADSLQVQLAALGADITRRIDDADSVLGSSEATSHEKRNEALRAALRGLTSEDFVVLTEFRVPAEQAAEWNSALGDSVAIRRYLDGLGKDFPVDEWLYGVARVREKMMQVEATAVQLEGLSSGSLDLAPCQFPYRLGDYWLALEYPDVDPDTGEPFVVDEDKLLYTARYPSGFDAASSQCGLLVDEWTEVVPKREETTGLTFHFDRPGNEPPQTLLLALPSDFDGAWDWQELVDTLHQTLDFAVLRGVEPQHLDSSQIGRFLPAIISRSMHSPVMAMMDLAHNNGIHLQAELNP